MNPSHFCTHLPCPICDYRPFPPPQQTAAEQSLWEQTVQEQMASNPKQRFGDLKAQVHLVPPALILGTAKAMKEGADKYGAYNWRSSKVEIMTYIAGALRHLYAFMDGEDVDPESKQGKLHLEGVAACMAIALDAWYGGFMVDNRPAKGPAPEMVRTPLVKEKDE